VHLVGFIISASNTAITYFYWHFFFIFTALLLEPINNFLLLVITSFSLRVWYYCYLLLAIIFMSAQELYFEISVMLWPYDICNMNSGGGNKPWIWRAVGIYEQLTPDWRQWCSTTRSPGQFIEINHVNLLLVSEAWILYSKINWSSYSSCRTQ